MSERSGKYSSCVTFSSEGGLNECHEFFDKSRMF